VRGLVAGEALQSQGGREYLKDMVRSVQDEMSTEQRQDDELRREERQQERPGRNREPEGRNP
jgi:hypothetical protein